MATKILSVSLDEHLAAFVEREVASWDYHSSDDVVRAAMQLLEEQCEARERLRAALQEGIDSEDVGPIDIEVFLRSKDPDEVRSRAA